MFLLISLNVFRNIAKLFFRVITTFWKNEKKKKNSIVGKQRQGETLEWKIRIMIKVKKTEDGNFQFFIQSSYRSQILITKLQAFVIIKIKFYKIFPKI